MRKKKKERKNEVFLQGDQMTLHTEAELSHVLEITS